MTKTAKHWWILIGTCLSALMCALDYTIMNTALNVLQTAFQCTERELTWFIAGFGLTFSSLMATSGRLADLKGRKRCLLIGIIGFALSSLGAASAHTATQLITYRILQGVFGSLIFPAGMAITASTFPREQTGKALGIYGGVIGIGLALGPLIGGIITYYANWHWLFLINVPIAAISTGICCLIVPESKQQNSQSLDIAGMCLITSCLASFIIAITEAPLLGWSNPIIIGLFIYTAISLFGLLSVERRVASPLLPLHLFGNNGFIIGSATMVVGISMAWIIAFFIPRLLNQVMSLDTLSVSLMMLPLTLMTVIIPPLAGRVYDRAGYASAARWFVFVPVFAAYFLMMHYHVDTSMLYISVSCILFGIAWGGSNGLGLPMTVSRLKNFDDDGVVTASALTIVNSVALALLAISSTLFSWLQRHTIQQLINKAQLKLSAPSKQWIFQQLLNNSHSKAPNHITASLHTQLVQYSKIAFINSYVHLIQGLIIITAIIFSYISYRFTKKSA